MTLPVDTPQDTELRRCGCCGRHRPADQVAELGSSPGVYICAICGLWAARRAGLMSAVREIRLAALLPRRRRRGPHTARAAIPVLPSTDLDRTAAFYSAAGFDQPERHDQYLLLRNGDVELHFSLHDTVTPTTCYVHVTDAAKMWKQLRHLNIDGVGQITRDPIGLPEFTITDPDGNQVRIGTPRA
jgi:hypothetical protein